MVHNNDSDSLLSVVALHSLLDQPSLVTLLLDSIATGSQVLVAASWFYTNHHDQGLHQTTVNTTLARCGQQLHYNLFYFMENNNILYVDNELHVFCLHYVFLKHSLCMFVNA